MASHEGDSASEIWPNKRDVLSWGGQFSSIFCISVHLKYGLIREVFIGRSVLIRQVPLYALIFHQSLCPYKTGTSVCTDIPPISWFDQHVFSLYVHKLLKILQIDMDKTNPTYLLKNKYNDSSKKMQFC